MTMRQKLSILLALLTVAAAVVATVYLWNPGLLEREVTDTSKPTKAEYYCPMHPQQRSDKPGDCPICSMKLVRLEKAPESTVETAKDQYYCPMHPQQRSDKPGNCPICSMKLVKMEGTVAQEHDAAKEPPMAAEAPTVFISPERQQLIGVRTVVAERKPLSREIWATGKIAFDETKVTHIHTKISGFIEEVFADYVGKPVKSGQPLFTIYSPDLVATQEEYLLALRSSDSLKDSSFQWVSKGSTNLLEAARKRLQLWDISEQEIRELEKSEKAKRALTIFSPVSGIVTQRAAYHHGRNVTPEMELYTIVDLSTVWALGEVYEHELPLIRIGQSVQVEFPYGAGTRVRNGRITFVSPTLDPKTRTAEVRVEFANPDLTLRPDMFVNFKARVSFGSPLVVPADAVLDTGTEQYVFVDKGQGYFEPRMVTVGQEADGLYAIERGLRPGERVVTAANFILDSESRLKGAFPGTGMAFSAHAAHTGAASPGMRVEILEPRSAKTGKNRIRLMARDSDGNPISGADVDITLFMPQMGNMAPMRAGAKLTPMGQGQYEGEVDIPMAWTWETTVTAKKDGKVVGSAKTSITAR
jgi:membrane fusion protein, copper/silver efflux system